MHIDLKYIGQQITLNSLRDAILDLGISDKDTIVLNSTDFDNIVIEHNETTHNVINPPFLYLGVLIKEDKEGSVPLNRIGIVKNDTESLRIHKSKTDYFHGEIAYRCGWCGNIVDSAGYELTGESRQRIIRYLNNYHSPITKNVDGKCCPNGDRA